MDHGRRDWFPAALLAAFVLVWIGFAIDPLDRSDWVLENLLVFASVPAFIVAHRRLGFSRAALVSIFVFLVLHVVGSHWSYSSVPLPWEDWGFERNQYDRVVHFAFGLLLWLPAREVVTRVFGLGRVAASLFAACALMTGSAVYEVLEWGAVQVVAPDLGNAFLGAQGDEFDATKDMAMAGTGILIAVGLAAVAAWVARRRTAAEGPGAG